MTSKTKYTSETINLTITITVMSASKNMRRTTDSIGMTGMRDTKEMIDKTAMTETIEMIVMIDTREIRMTGISITIENESRC